MSESESQEHFSAEQVLQLVNQTSQNIFLTGKAGTGKTTLLKRIVAETHKNHIVVAPTGVAAINAGGVTIHSMFQLPFNAFLPTDYYNSSNPQQHFDTTKSILRHFKVRGDKRAIIQNLELLIIDEVSMLRPDILDSMNLFLQTVRYNRKPFGGVQVLFIGDLMQLPPIIKNADWDVMRDFYKSKFFFDAKVLEQEQPIYVELTKIYRQSDSDFIDILQKMRLNQFDEDIIDKLDRYVERDFEVKDNPGHIVLTTHNQQADTINQSALSELRKKEMEYDAKIVDDFPENLFPIDKSIKLKVGAQVMFIKNDLNFDKRYYNGKIAEIVHLDHDEITVRFLDTGYEMIVDEHIWENIKYKTNPMTQEIEEEVVGTYTQYPLRLAWAITVHKSQGLTFEKAAIDISQIFAPGQAYVALSRLTSLKGLKLIQPIGSRKIEIDKELIQYENNKLDSETIQNNLGNYSKDYLLQICTTCFEHHAVARWVSRMQKEIVETGDQSIVGKYKSKLDKAFYMTNEILVVSEKFQKSIQQIILTQDFDIQYVNERISKSYDYFHPLWMSLERYVLEIIAELAYVTRVKEFENDMIEFESLTLLAIKKLLKTKKIVDLITDKKEVNKQSVRVDELEREKRAIIEDLKAKNSVDLKSLIQPFEIKKKDKSEKVEKKPTHILTYELWLQYKDILKVAEVRKLTTQTIFTHLTKYVEKGAMDIEELISIEKLNEIKNEIKFDFEKYDSLSDLKTIYPDYNYNELKLYILWRKMNKNYPIE